jgi:hypothetical protein
MLSLYAVAHADLFENDIKIELLQGNTPKEAIRQHSRFKTCNVDDQAEIDKWLNIVPETEEEIKQFFFDVDILVGYLLVKGDNK